MLTAVQPHPSAVSATHDAPSVWPAQGSIVSPPHSHGAQALPAGQAGQLHAGNEGAPVDDAPPPPLVASTVMVEVAAALHAQLQAGQA